MGQTKPCTLNQGVNLPAVDLGGVALSIRAAASHTCALLQGGFTPNPRPETRDPRPETRSQTSETRNPKPETRDPRPETPGFIKCWGSNSDARLGTGTGYNHPIPQTLNPEPVHPKL